MDDDAYIKVLAQAREDLNNLEGITWNDFKDRVNRLGIKQNQDYSSEFTIHSWNKDHACFK